MADHGLTGILLVGGQSRRFGSPKELAEFRGETLRERALRLLGEVCDERIAVGRDGLADPGTGPVAAIAAGLRAAAHELVVVVPVDMPLLTADALQALADACRDVAVSQAGPLPCAVRRSVLPELERGERRLRLVFERLDTAVVTLADDMLANVNEPDDLAGLA